MDLRQVEFFLAVVEERHFTRAAARTHVSQSGLSAAIRSLEQELGAPLFVRTTRSVELSEAGHAFLGHARDLLARASAGREAVTATTRELQGVLRVGTEQCLGFVDVPGLMARFHHRHPLVDLVYAQAGSVQLVARVRDDELDLAFVAATGNDTGSLDQVELAAESLVLLCAPGRELAENDKVAWAELDGLTYVDFEPGWAARTMNDRAARTNGLTRRVRCTVNDVHTLLELVRLDLGVALVPRPVARKPQAAGLAVLELFGGPVPTWQISAITRPGRAAAPPVAQFLAELRSAERRIAELRSAAAE